MSSVFQKEVARQLHIDMHTAVATVFTFVTGRGQTKTENRVEKRCG